MGYDCVCLNNFISTNIGYYFRYTLDYTKSLAQDLMKNNRI